MSVANLLGAWNEFKRGKRKKADVALFELHLENNLLALHWTLRKKTYTHEPYAGFYVCDPKRRHIHKATVRDRVLHQAVFRVLYRLFDKHFIFDSYASRVGKGTHLGVSRLGDACRKASKNWRVSTYALKCDVRKFFDSIDHAILRALIRKKVTDPNLLWLIDILLASFAKAPGKGLPLGNVTSQLFANIYLDELDQYVKHELKAKHYFRYCDDFVIVHADHAFLAAALTSIGDFLREKLLLYLHPNKAEIRKIKQGIDFLGYVTLPHVAVLRTRTKKRMLRKLHAARQKFVQGTMNEEKYRAIVASYLGILSHARSRNLTTTIRRSLI